MCRHACGTCSRLMITSARRCARLQASRQRRVRLPCRPILVVELHHWVAPCQFRRVYLVKRCRQRTGHCHLGLADSLITQYPRIPDVPSRLPPEGMSILGIDRRLRSGQLTRHSCPASPGDNLFLRSLAWRLSLFPFTSPREASPQVLERWSNPGRRSPDPGWIFRRRPYFHALTKVRSKHCAAPQGRSSSGALAGREGRPGGRAAGR
jgi:hypothetical protein